VFPSAAAGHGIPSFRHAPARFRAVCPAKRCWWLIRLPRHPVDRQRGQNGWSRLRRERAKRAFGLTLAGPKAHLARWMGACQDGAINHQGPTAASRQGPTAAGRQGPTAAGRQGPTAAGRQGPTAAGHQGPTAAGRQGPTAAGRQGPTAAHIAAIRAPVPAETMQRAGMTNSAVVAVRDAEEGSESFRRAGPSQTRR
jgi:hypothetical protein